jgi:predicted HTH domain antitoxin
MYKNGRIILNDASDLAGITTREITDLLIERGVPGNVRIDQQRNALDYAIKS